MDLIVLFTGGEFVNFLPAIGDDERKRIGRIIRRWRLHRRSGSTLTDLAEAINAEVQGWINFYGRFYRSELVRLLRRINEYLIRWARWKYKRLRRSRAKALRFLAAVYRREPGLSGPADAGAVPALVTGLLCRSRAASYQRRTAAGDHPDHFKRVHIEQAEWTALPQPRGAGEERECRSSSRTDECSSSSTPPLSISTDSAGLRTIGAGASGDCRFCGAG